MEEGHHQKTQQRRQVVTEEEYTSTLSTIIQRDFFSDIRPLQLKAAVLARREARDIVGAVQLRRAYRKIQSHEEALEELEAQAEAEAENGLRKTARPLHRETLTGFHHRVTSEDNAEFQRAQQKEVKANRERLEALFQSVPQQLLLKANGECDSHYPALASDEYDQLPSPNKFLEWKQSTAQSAFFSVPTGACEPSAGSSLKLLQNTASEEQNSYLEQDRTLMPPPTSKHAIVRSIPMEYISKQILEKRIEPSQTRFPSTPTNSLLALRPGATVDSSYSTDASTDLESEGGSTAEERRARAREAEREKQIFVNMTPLVVPGATDAPEASPIITWGAVAGMPLLLSQDKAADAQKRQAMISRGKHSGTTGGKVGASPRAKRDFASFSPAAMSLLAKTSKQSGSFSVRSASSLGAALRSSYTPQARRTGSSNRRRDSATCKATPRVLAGESTWNEPVPPSTAPTKANSNITAGLLE